MPSNGILNDKAIPGHLVAAVIFAKGTQREFVSVSLTWRTSKKPSLCQSQQDIIGQEEREGVGVNSLGSSAGEPPLRRNPSICRVPVPDTTGETPRASSSAAPASPALMGVS